MRQRLVFSSPLLLALLGPVGTLALAGCAVDDLGSDDEFGNPPDSDTFDPTLGTDGGSSTGTDEGTTDTTDTGPPECDDANKRCDHEFTLVDQGYQQVEVVGDFAPGAWDQGVGLALEGGTWRTNTEVPWATQVLYKFKVDGGEIGRAHV